MSQTGNRETENRCDDCGSAFPSKQALGGHRSNGCPNAEGADTGGAILADDLLLREIPHAATNMREADFRATLDHHDFEPSSGDSLGTAFAKALIRAKDGDREAYVEVFGKCATDGCEYGANGFEANLCKRHEESPEEEADDPSGATDEQVREAVDEPSGEASESRATYVAKLIRNGVGPVEAEQAATARFGGA